MARWILLVATVSALLVESASGDSLIPLGAEGIKRADIVVLIGGGLGQDSPAILQLFGGDAARAERFEAALRAAMTERLRKNGITFEPRSMSGFAVSIFGRPVDSKGGCDRYAVVIRFAVSNRDRYPGSSQPVAEQEVIETPADQQLEEDIQRRVLMLLDKALTKPRASAHEHRPTSGSS